MTDARARAVASWNGTATPLAGVTSARLRHCSGSGAVAAEWCCPWGRMGVGVASPQLSLSTRDMPLTIRIGGVVVRKTPCLSHSARLPRQGVGCFNRCGAHPGRATTVRTSSSCGCGRVVERGSPDTHPSAPDREARLARGREWSAARFRRASGWTGWRWSSAELHHSQTSIPDLEIVVVMVL